MNQKRNPLPEFCARYPKCKNVCKEYRRKYCSNECYSLSGVRRINGQRNGKKWAENYWKRFAIKFEEKYGHLDRVDQIRIAVTIGIRKAYRGRHRGKLSLSTTVEGNGCSPRQEES